MSGYELPKGRVIAGKYEVIETLGAGLEGEVYWVREIDSGIFRAAKLFFTERNRGNKTSTHFAQKMHRLRHCQLTIHHNASVSIRIKGETVIVLISEYIHGMPLSRYLEAQPGKRLLPFEAVHLLYVLAKGVAEFHQMGEYHGDLHSDNIMVERVGLTYHLKLIDMFDWKDSVKANIRRDTVDLVKILHEVLGGQKRYAKHPDAIKAICCGLKHNLILKKFRNAAELCQYLENFSWVGD